MVIEHWTGRFGFLKLALFLQAFDLVHLLMVWCGPKQFVYKDGLYVMYCEVEIESKLVR